MALHACLRRQRQENCHKIEATPHHHPSPTLINPHYLLPHRSTTVTNRIACEFLERQVLLKLHQGGGCSISESSSQKMCGKEADTALGIKYPRP